MKHTIKNPLKLLCDRKFGHYYKVNKPNQGTQELVSKEVAQELADALKIADKIIKAAQFEYDILASETNLNQIQTALKNANS